LAIAKPFLLHSIPNFEVVDFQQALRLQVPIKKPAPVQNMGQGRKRNERGTKSGTLLFWIFLNQSIGDSNRGIWISRLDRD